LSFHCAHMLASPRRQLKSDGKPDDLDKAPRQSRGSRRPSKNTAHGRHRPPRGAHKDRCELTADRRQLIVAFRECLQQLLLKRVGPLAASENFRLQAIELLTQRCDMLLLRLQRPMQEAWVKIWIWCQQISPPIGLSCQSTRFRHGPKPGAPKAAGKHSGQYPLTLPSLAQRMKSRLPYPPVSLGYGSTRPIGTISCRC
jgi:hypothetical protein